MKALLTLSALLFHLAASAQYQNHSGLRDKKLRVANIDNRQIFDEVQGGLPSDDKLPEWPPRAGRPQSRSRIDSVIVLDDAPLHLTLTVYFSGVMRADIEAGVSMNESGAKRYIVPQQLAVQEGQSPAELTLKAVMPENLEVRSRHLTITLKESDPTLPKKEYVFSLGKKWNSEIRGENLVQTINLEPIGAAASLWQLDASAPLPSPSRAMPAVVDREKTSVQPGRHFTDKNPRGPSRHAFSLWDNIKTDIDFELSDINNIRTEIYPDINPASETFYISPVDYHLRWTPQQGFQNFRIIYGANGQVQFHAGLNAGITSSQLETTRYLIRKLMRAQNVEIASPRLQLLGANTMPSISLQSDFQGVFQIDASKISVSPPADFTSPMQISFATDNKTKDMIVAALQNGIGLNGSLTFDTDSISRKIPLSIAFADKRNYGKIILEKANWRQGGWQNPFPYPVRIRYLHALVDNGDQAITAGNHIYTWNCNGPVAPPSSRIGFNAVKIPQWFDNSSKVVQLWLEYEMVACASCTNTIIQSLTSGQSASSESSLTFQSMDLLAALNAKMVQIRVRSKQADPARLKEAELTANLVKDGEDVRIGPLYTGTDRLNYQYKIIIVSKDIPVETSWISETNPQIFLNKVSLERLLGRTLK